MAYSGVFMGPLLDGIHSRVGLQVYDVAPLVFGGLRTSALVPVLLAVFYAVLGALHPLADNLSPSPETESVRQRSSDVLYVALTFGALAGLLYLSATLYDQGVPYWQIHAILGTATIINWRIFDGTRQGLILAAVCGLGAPAAEALLLQIAPLWHYPRADVGGFFVSWVCWCYAFYTPSVGNTARYAWNLMRDIEKAQQEYRRGMAQALEQQRLGQPPQPQQPPAQQEDKPQR
ncbi:hypothetical protein HYH03_015638 [Edaphochlamys debaryana]|uniref:Uncharacterized protein n=1 Tax=Edaphochlamys debaryana TaxID=47281 RepID=A0A836BQQ6_9CHLO|nr:hypothetical protein HYH03_015638 [Edaphochlamys debaryana]|eukprot:KAG2485666.1 hypothetical protein HYH03_015638 [Edaphochlamys debaryana]